MTCPTLTPAAQVDAQERIDTYFEKLESSGDEIGFDQSNFIKAMLADAVDALGPSILALHDIVAARPEAIQDTRVLDLGNRFVHAIEITLGDRLLAFAVATEAPVRSSPQVSAMIAAEEALMRDADPACGEERRGFDDLTRSIVAKIRVEERCQAQGWPSDFEQAPRGRIERAFAVLDKADETRSAMRTLAQGKWHSALFDASPAFDFHDGSWSHTEPRIDGVCEWSEAFDALRAPLEQAGLMTALGERAKLLAQRGYTFYGDPDNEGDKALMEAAPAVAGMDGGLPGKKATELATAFEARVAAMKLAPAIRLASHLGGAQAGRDHDNHDGIARFDPKGEDGGGVITLTHYDETYLIALAVEDGATTLEVSRPGVSPDLGRYAIGRDGKTSCLREPPYTTRCVRDVSKIDALMGSAFCIDFEDEAQPACG